MLFKLCFIIAYEELNGLRPGHLFQLFFPLDFVNFFLIPSIPDIMTTINTANINFKWDPKSLEIRTLAVERLLEPLVTQVM